MTECASNKPEKKVNPQELAPKRLRKSKHFSLDIGTCEAHKIGLTKIYSPINMLK